ncbi:hypothetical protein [Brevundimonas sp.]|uniref:hypothetical protein n=1 Tax=Brevundimonas sp. TaxID=1871086 RepID=UPI00344B0313
MVEDISLGFTMLRTDDGRSLIIANGAMAQQTLIACPRRHRRRARPPRPKHSTDPRSATRDHSPSMFQ